MGHTSKWQIWVQWLHFSRLLVTVDFDGLSTKLLKFSSLSLVNGSYELLANLGALVTLFKAVGYCGF